MGTRSFGRNTKLDKAVGNKIAEIRKKLGLTQDQVAKRMGIDQTTVVRIENGDYAITLTKLVRYAEALGVEINLKLPSKDGNISYQTLLILTEILWTALLVSGTEVASTASEVSVDATDGPEITPNQAPVTPNAIGSQDDSGSSLQETSMLPELPVSP